MKRILALSLACIMFVLCFASCGQTADTLTMATNASFPPYEYVEDGFKGIDVEIAGLIAEKLGKKLEIQDVDFGAIIGGVQTGKYDMGMAGMTVTPDRKKSVNFSDTYATGVQVVIVKEGSEIKSVDDIAKAVAKGAKIGVQQDTTGDIYASDKPENDGYGEENVTRFKNGSDAVQALITDKVGCVIIDNEPAKAYVEKNKGLKILETEFVTEDYAICVAKDNTELLNSINKALKELKDEGKIDEIIEKYIPSK